MIRPIRRRALLAAVLPAAVAACALPAAAQAAKVEEAPGGTLRFVGEGSEQNILSVTRPTSNALELQNLGGITSRTPLCAQVSNVRVRCAIGIQLSEVKLNGGNDLASINVSDRMTVDGGIGNDVIGPGPATGGKRVTYIGGQGFDTVTYDDADRGVKVAFSTFDGRPGLDQDTVASDVEKLVGSDFNDELSAFAFNATLNGGRGDDVLTGNATPRAITTFDMGRRADGADGYIALGDNTRVDYSQRTAPVTVRPGNAKSDDGEAGEGDSITSGSLIVDGGAAGDIIDMTAAPGNHSLHGNGGDDRIDGSNLGEFLGGGPGVDTLVANGGNDGVDAQDGGFDVVGCGAGLSDFASLDAADVSSSCETKSVGVLRLAPKTVRAEAGGVAKVELSWRHPKAWKQLRAIELRLTHDRVPVGSLTIRPGRERVADDGAVRVKRARVVAKGKTVSAKLAVRLDKRLAGQTLDVEVEATDQRGARQLERNAGSIRVAP